jgi:predicted Zn-dependent peptidase
MKKLTTLDNGLRIVTHHMASVKSVSFGVYNNVGSRDETEEINGTAHFLEHMAFKGTKTRSAKEIAQTIDNVGGMINAGTSKETTTYESELLAENLNVGVDIITDILQNSIFESKGFEKERGVILQEIAMNQDNPSRMVSNQCLKTAFPNQPLGRLVIGTKEIIQSIKREKIIDFMQNYYHPKKMVFSAAGLVNHDEFVDMIVKSTPDLPQGKADSRIKGFYKGGEYREEKELEQIHMLLGFKGLDAHDDDYETLQVYSAIMGIGMSSRLFQEIREKRGLVYNISSGKISFEDTGAFFVKAGTGENKIKELFPVLCDELIKSPQNITEEEIARAKAQLKFNLVKSMEFSMVNADICAHDLIKYNRLVEIEEKIEKINNVSKESIERVVRKMLQSKPTIASIGPIKNLEKLEKIQSRFN